MLASVPSATAETSVDAGAATLGVASYTVSELPASGDITAALKRAVAIAGTSYQANVVHLSGAVSVSSIIHPADYVYIVADPGTTVTWRGSDGYLLRYNAGITGGVSGGTWDGAGRSSTTLIGTAGAFVTLADLTLTHAGKYGVVGYEKSTLTLNNITSSYNKVDGVHLEESTLNATGLRSVYNRRNGVQLSSGSVGTISGSVLDRNGQAVSGSTDGKTGHGLGVASATATVTNTSLSKNKVCGASLTGSADATFVTSNLDGNGRHGLGTTPGTTAKLTDSTANNDGYNGVLASGSRTHVTLDRVTITAAKKMGLSVPSGGSATVTNSVITGGKKYDVSVSTKGKLTLAGGNTISASRSHGITVSGKSSITVSGLGNQVIGSSGDGLRITGSGTTGRITESASFLNNRGSGIVVVSKAKLWMVRDCAFSLNKKAVEKRSGGKLYYY
jgi:hypothetical protein